MIYKNMNISFSIIMPTYNRKNCIKNAIDSLLTQTYQNFELIIIDDGSTDKTEEYLMLIYEKEIKEGKIKFFRFNKNNGVCFARNEGLKKAKNNWIGYLDTDNKMHPDFLDTFAINIDKNKDNNIFYAQVQMINLKRIVGRSFDFDQLIIENFIDLGSFIHSIDVYNKIGGFDLKLNRLVDWDLIIRYTERYTPIFIEKVLLDYNDVLDFTRITMINSSSENYKKIIINYYKRNNEEFPEKKFMEKYTEYYNRVVDEEQRQKKELLNVFQLKCQELKITKEQLIFKNNELIKIYNSIGWKLILFIRRILYGIFPLGSLRRKISVFIFKFCEKKTRYFLNKINRFFVFKKEISKKIKLSFKKIIIWLNKTSYNSFFNIIYWSMFNGKIGSKDITVIVHLYYNDMWPYIADKLKNIPHEYTLIVSLTEGYFDESIIEIIKKYKIDTKFFIFENKGMDILPFLKCLKYVPKTTKYLLKIHTKKSPQNPYGSAWFNDLIEHTLSGRHKVKNIFYSLENTNIGMIGGCNVTGFEYGGLLNSDQFYEKKIELINEYYKDNSTDYKWVAGSIFWVRFDVINKFDSDFINFFEKKQPLGYSMDGTIAHGLERYFGKLIYNAGEKVSLDPEKITIKKLVFYIIKRLSKKGKIKY